MATRERRLDRGRRIARSGLARLGSEHRLARRAAGLSLREVARAAGSSHQQLARFERGELDRISVGAVGRWLAVVGLDLSVRAYPSGDASRDIGHARLLARFRRELHPSLQWRTEVPLPIQGDRRAWDGVVEGRSWRLVVEAETVIEDLQALERKLSLKIRDGGVDHAILLVADTARNRRALALATPAALNGLPGRSREILAALRAGIEPSGSGIVIR